MNVPRERMWNPKERKSNFSSCSREPALSCRATTSGAKLDYEMEHEGRHISSEPLLHIGRTAPKTPGEILVPPCLPWQDDDEPADKIRKFLRTSSRLRGLGSRSVDLESVCDHYLRTIWTLSLSAPLPYLDSHPFDLKSSDELTFFLLENTSKGQAERLSLKGTETLRQKFDLKSPDTKKGDSFTIEFDGVQLARPIVFRDQPKTSTAVKTPILSVGHCRETFKGKPGELSGGPLEFEAYLLWTPKVVPTQHQGVVIRVGNASGTLFDRTFMGYQISEQTRLRRITAEIFIREGFDGAINLDRENYNYAHPHYRFIVRWLHSALRQLTNRHKELRKNLRTDRLAKEGKKTRAALDNKVVKLLEARGVEDLPEVVLLAPDEKKRAAGLRREGIIVLNKEAIVPSSPARRHTAVDAERMALAEKKAVAVAQILETWGVLKGLSYDEQNQLVREIVEVTLFGGEE